MRVTSSLAKNRTSFVPKDTEEVDAGLLMCFSNGGIELYRRVLEREIEIALGGFCVYNL